MSDEKPETRYCLAGWVATQPIPRSSGYVEPERLRLRDVITRLQKLERDLATNEDEETRNPIVGSHDPEYGSFLGFRTIEKGSDAGDNRPGGNLVIVME